MGTKVGSLEIDIAANIARLTQDMNSAKAEVKKSAEAMQGSIARMQQHMEESLKGVKQSLEVFKGLAELGGATLLGEKLLELGRSAAEYGDQIERASRMTGVNTDALQKLSFAAGQSDISFDQLRLGLTRLSRSMAEAQQGNKAVAAAFQSVGIGATQLKNLKVDEVLARVSDRFSQTQDGAAKTALAMQLFGRAGAELIPLLDQGSQKLDALGDRAQQLGLVLDEDTIRKSAALNEELKTLGAQTHMATIQMGLAFMPALQAVAQAMEDGLKPGGLLSDTFKGLGVALKDLVIGLELSFQSLEVITAGMAGAIVTVGGVINAALHLDWDGIKAAWQRGLTETRLAVDQEVGGMIRTIRAAHGELDVLKESPEEGRKPLGQLSLGSVTGGRAKDTLLAQWRNQLDQMRDAEGAYHELSKQEELAFWQGKLLLVKKGTQDYNAVLHEVVNVERQIYQENTRSAQKASAEALALRVNQLDQEAALDRNRLAQVSENNRFLLASGRISEREKLKRDQEVANEEYTIALDLLARKLALYQDDAKERARIDGEIERLNAQHGLAMQKAVDDAALANQKSYQQMMAPITSAFDTSIKGIIMGTQTWQQAMQRAFSSILSSFIDMGIQMVGKWVAQQLAMTIATTTGNAARVASDQAAAGSSLATSAATLIKSILNSAQETFAGIFGFLAPVMGPAAAAPAAAGMGTVAAVAGSVASSAGGEWRIPMDRLQFVHKNETILPAHIAGGLRNLVERGGGAPSHQIHIHATDAQSVERLFRNNGAALAAALKTHLRNFGS